MPRHAGVHLMNPRVERCWQRSGSCRIGGDGGSHIHFMKRVGTLLLGVVRLLALSRVNNQRLLLFFYVPLGGFTTIVCLEYPSSSCLPRSLILTTKTGYHSSDILIIIQSTQYVDEFCSFEHRPCHILANQGQREDCGQLHLLTISGLVFVLYISFSFSRGSDLTYYPWHECGQTSPESFELVDRLDQVVPPRP